jgi:integrase
MESIIVEILGKPRAKRYLQKYEFLNTQEVKKWLIQLKNRSHAKNGFGYGNFRAVVNRLKKFLDFTGMTPTELIDEIERDRTLPVRKQMNPGATKIKSFFDFLLKNVAPKTAQATSNTVRGFYKHNGFRLQVHIGEQEESKQKVALTKELIREVLNNTPHIRDKAILLIMASSGMSITDVLDLKYRHIQQELDTGITPLKIEFRRTKNNSKYTTFLSRECVTVLKQYLKQRGTLESEEYLFLNLLNKKLSYRSFREVLARISEKTLGATGINSKAFRRFFETQMLIAGVPSDLVKFMMGHSIGITASYAGANLLENPEPLRELYASKENEVTIMTTVVKQKALELKSEIFREFNEEKLQLKEENQQLKEEMSNITVVMTQLQQQVQKLQEKFA